MQQQGLFWIVNKFQSEISLDILSRCVFGCFFDVFLKYSLNGIAGDAADA